MRELIIGMLIGSFGAWIYRSEQARDQIQQQLSNAPAPVRQKAESLASATVSSTRRVVDVVGATPLTRQLKDRAAQATTAVRSAADKTRGLNRTAGDEQPLEQPLGALIENPTPEELLAEQDAAARATEEARRQQQAGL